MPRKSNVVTPARFCAQESAPAADLAAEDCASQVSRSPEVSALGTTLRRLSLTMEAHPIIAKPLTERYFRVIFPVAGRELRRGTIVAVACLYDRDAGRTLYAHPMHAGPDANPVLKYLNGPMAFPKPQPGKDGERAIERLLEHKRALWSRYLRERTSCGPAQAAARWRQAYYWALKRLYFCTSCADCRWSSPFFDGPGGRDVQTAAALARVAPEPMSVAAAFRGAVADVVSSDAWRTEREYAARGGYGVALSPRLVRVGPGGHIHLAFATDAALIQAGTPVAVAAIYHEATRQVEVAQCLFAGPHVELLFRAGRCLGAPSAQEGSAGRAARTDYARWRRESWLEFWLAELEEGLAVASGNWLRGFWAALARLLGGNDLPAGETVSPSHGTVAAAEPQRSSMPTVPEGIPMQGTRSAIGKIPLVYQTGASVAR